MTSERTVSTRVPVGAALLRQLDHVVLAVHDLERAVEDFRALGFTVTPGGQHPGRTSHNALVAFEDGAYIEIIAWHAPATEERWWQTLQTCGEGLVDHALLPVSVEPVLAAAQARGLLTLRGPIPGSRHRPDGIRIAWESARHDAPDVPFLCADLTPRALRVPEGAARQHSNGATGIARVAVAARDFGRSAARWIALLGPGSPLRALPSELGLSRARYRLSSTEFELFGLKDTPRSTSPAIDPDVFGWARERLNQTGEGYGEGPFAIWLRGEKTGRTLDLTRCHGAHIVLGNL